jgi:hypothetical protein
MGKRGKSGKKRRMMESEERVGNRGEKRRVVGVVGRSLRGMGCRQIGEFGLGFVVVVSEIWVLVGMHPSCTLGFDRNEIIISGLTASGSMVHTNAFTW